MMPTPARVLLVPLLLALGCTGSPKKETPGDSGEPSSTPAVDSSDSAVPEVVLEPHLERVATIVAGAHGLVALPDGSLLYSDTFANAGRSGDVWRVEAGDAGPGAPLGLDANDYAGMAWTDAGVWLANIGSGGLLQLDGEQPTGTRWRAGAAWNVVAAADHTYTVNADGEVHVVGAGMAPSTHIRGLEFPFDAVVDPTSGGLWVTEQVSAADDGRLTLFNADGDPVRTIAHAWSNPEGLGVDGEGMLWVAETGAGLLLRFDPETGDLLHQLEVDGLPILIVSDPTTHDLFVSVTGEDPSVWRLGLRPVEE